jgi:hypothetical protein
MKSRNAVLADALKLAAIMPDEVSKAALHASPFPMKAKV